MRLKEGQWYQMPNGQWAKAVWVDDPLGPILQAYGYDVASRTGYTTTFDVYVEKDGHTLGVTGLCTWDTWTVADLREATPDEAEAQTYRCLNIPQLTHHAPPHGTPSASCVGQGAAMPAFTLRVMPCLDNDPVITYDVYVVDHPDFAAGGDDATAAVLAAIQRILSVHPRCTLTVETVEDFAPAVVSVQAYAREHLGTQPADVVLAYAIDELRAANALNLVRHLEERRDLGQLVHAWQVRMAINKLTHIAALSHETQG